MHERNRGSKIRQTAATAVGLLALAFGAWACASSTGSGGGGGDTCDTTGGSTSDGGMCEDSFGPDSKKTPCDCDHVHEQCPLPKSSTLDDGEYTTVTYYSNPTCEAGFCHYCMTKTMTEDPGVTGVP